MLRPERQNVGKSVNVGVSPFGVVLGGGVGEPRIRGGLEGRNGVCTPPQASSWCQSTIKRETSSSLIQKASDERIEEGKGTQWAGRRGGRNLGPPADGRRSNAATGNRRRGRGGVRGGEGTGSWNPCACRFS